MEDCGGLGGVKREADVQLKHTSEEDALILTQTNGSSRPKLYFEIAPSIVLESTKHGLSGVRRLGRTQTDIGLQ